MDYIGLHWKHSDLCHGSQIAATKTNSGGLDHGKAANIKSPARSAFQHDLFTGGEKGVVAWSKPVPGASRVGDPGWETVGSRGRIGTLVREIRLLDWGDLATMKQKDIRVIS